MKRFLMIVGVLFGLGSSCWGGDEAQWQELFAQLSKGELTQAKMASLDLDDALKEVLEEARQKVLSGQRVDPNALYEPLKLQKPKASAAAPALRVSADWNNASQHERMRMIFAGIPREMHIASIVGEQERRKSERNRLVAEFISLKKKYRSTESLTERESITQAATDIFVKKAKNKPLTDEEQAAMQSRNLSTPRRWWQMAEAYGVAPALVGDAADMMTFGSHDQNKIAAGAAVSGAMRVADTFANAPFIHSPMTEEEAQVALPKTHRNKDIQLNADIRASESLKRSGVTTARGLTSLSQYLVQPLTGLHETHSTLTHKALIADYNKYLSEHQDNARLSDYLRSLKRKKWIMGGMMFGEAALHILKYAAYLNQKHDPGQYYADERDAQMIRWANMAAGSAAALSMVRRLWWNRTKAAHIERAQQQAELIGMRPQPLP